MDLGLTDEQRALVASFANLLAKESTPERVRAAEPSGFDPQLWTALRAVGVVEMAVAEDQGGWGADLLDLALVAEQVGVAAAPAPVIEAQCAARLLAVLGRPAGDRLVTLAVRPATEGRATLVPAGAVADQVVVLDGDRLLLVDVDDGCRTPVANLAAAPLADIDLRSPAEPRAAHLRAIEPRATEPPATELCRGPEARERFETALDEWLVLTSAALVGLAHRAHSLTCEYARQRQTWNQPIGGYQAVAHPLADGRTAIDGARLLTAKAAWRLGRSGPDGRRLAALAFGFAADTARDVTYDAVHFHGGFGFTLESEVQLHYRRARGWARVWDEPRSAYRRATRAARSTRPTATA